MISYWIERRHLADSCERSLIRGGIKELVESLREMADQNSYQFKKLYYDGEQAKRDYLMKYGMDIQSQVDRNKILGLTKKMDEIMILLNPLDQISLSDVNIVRKISVQFEQQFKREITTLYYIHLCSYLFDFEFQTTEQWLCTLPEEPYSPKECLSLLIKNDADKPLLSEWFYDLMEEISNHQSEIYNALPKRQQS